MTAALRFDIGAMRFERRAVGGKQRGGDVERIGDAALRIDQHHLFGQARLDLLRRQHLHRDHLVPELAQPVRRGREAGVVHEVGQQHHQSARAARAEVAAQRRLQIGAAACAQPLEETQRGPHLGLAATHRQFMRDAVGPGHDAHAVVVDQRQIGQRRGDPPREIELRRLADAHRGTGVEEHVHRQVGLLLEQAQQQPVESEVDAPVEMLGVVTRRVRSEVGEHHAAAGATRAVRAAQVARHRPPGEHGEMLQTAQEIVAEQRRGVGHGWSGRAVLQVLVLSALSEGAAPAARAWGW